MKRFLLDTHLLLWATIRPDRLPPVVHTLGALPETQLVFSVVSLWEVAIKRRKGHRDFTVDERVLRRALLDHGYEELPILSAHVVAIPEPPTVHNDPFDHLLIAQAQVEGIVLLTADATLAQYPAPVQWVS
ncbi:MAG: type II toxin-antitoxin system VapC family toxin [Candidatus Competibacteraceae bacterium]|nr:type II toxin-antitoxin system VapC family toxin [Candidatus Competibacteraceae bacterium]